ncbi:MAG: hypothetical protein ACOYNN_16315 [Terrimicrobiaceae bacterium]
MRKLRIGYVPYSADLTHPGDRRRLVYWAKKRGHELVLNTELRCDVVFKTVRADLNEGRSLSNKSPYILDLVDGYLGHENYWRDWFRGAGKVVTGQISGPIKPFRKVVESACANAAAVVCETSEQAETIEPFCKNVHSTLDFHEEFPFLPFKNDLSTKRHTKLFWEGFPYTAKGLLLLSDFFASNCETENVSLEMVTDLKYPTILGKYNSKPTTIIVNEIIAILGSRFQITKWSLDSVISASNRANIAVLPLDPTGVLNPLKAENRLLIMWRLGMPTLASPSSAYLRVMQEVGIDGVCQNSEDWTMKLHNLIESPSLQKNMVEAGQQYVRDTHSEELVLQAWDNLFESVL